MGDGAYFSPDLLLFLSELEAHNGRDWFNANREHYETSVRDPVLRFIGDFAPRLARISPHFVADARPVGGSMMRIYRDTRFSRDKRPYHAAVIVHFWHERSRVGVTPGFSLRMEPGDSSLSAGIWQPERGALRRIREAIVANPETWRRLEERRRLHCRCVLVGRSLDRPPPGFDAQHPFIADLKRKDFACMMPVDDQAIVSASFIDDLTDAFAVTAPLVEFLTHAVGLSF
jgi:uncharacterized protein (TIGR02453 family)